MLSVFQKELAMTPDICVQVPVKNGGSFFRRFLGSLAAQDIQNLWEVVIVDDGSDIPVLEEFSRELGLLPGNCSVQVVRMNPGGNRPAARNEALKVSTAPVALLMDADMEFDSSLLRQHLEKRKETGADVVMGRRINCFSSNASPWQKWFDTRAMGSSPAGMFPWKYFITGNLSITGSLLEKAGGFDPAINCYGGEDTEIGYRLYSMGVSFRWEPELTVYHLDDVSVGKHSDKMLEYGRSGLLYTLRKHPGTRGLLGSRWVEPVFSSPAYLWPVRLAARAALLPAVYRAVLRFAVEHGRPYFLFTYLSVGACLTGLRGRDYKK
jgi:glycosyltransferase involved in cell wall biosynthesis